MVHKSVDCRREAVVATPSMRTKRAQGHDTALRVPGWVWERDVHAKNYVLSGMKRVQERVGAETRPNKRHCKGIPLPMLQLTCIREIVYIKDTVQRR